MAVDDIAPGVTKCASGFEADSLNFPGERSAYCTNIIQGIIADRTCSPRFSLDVAWDVYCARTYRSARGRCCFMRRSWCHVDTTPDSQRGSLTHYALASTTRGRGKSRADTGLDGMAIAGAPPKTAAARVKAAI
jgi:hypothetical protein